MTKLEHITQVTSALQPIRIMDANNKCLYRGYNGDFRATCEQAYDLLDKEVFSIVCGEQSLIIILK